MALILLSAYGWHNPSHSDTQTSDPLLKDVTAEELRGILQSFEGDKAVLVNVWATWCAPCIEEFPEIVKVQRKYEDSLRVIFISADFPDSRDLALQFLREQGVDWTTYFKTGSDQEFIEALSSEWTGALPFSKIINKEGEVVASWENSATFSKFDNHVKQALNR
ncbi:TlpA family protein disulfide reductase [Balneolaceae bacterium YR4-1]|uniref:TlpA family protein disulfide reductase n=2 Tax=Halalkalibaculum roseum TaxID=2709311 RepID=A0A6M1T977_9BACT|nr:TlpA family protein disulfide reductase [Halalkalibaculum roseum]